MGTKLDATEMGKLLAKIDQNVTLNEILADLERAEILLNNALTALRQPHMQEIYMRHMGINYFIATARTNTIYAIGKVESELKGETDGDDATGL